MEAIQPTIPQVIRNNSVTGRFFGHTAERAKSFQVRCTEPKPYINSRCVNYQTTLQDRNIQYDVKNVAEEMYESVRDIRGNIGAAVDINNVKQRFVLLYDRARYAHQCAIRGGGSYLPESTYKEMGYCVRVLSDEQYANVTQEADKVLNELSAFSRINDDTKKELLSKVEKLANTFIQMLQLVKITDSYFVISGKMGARILLVPYFLAVFDSVKEVFSSREHMSVD